MRKIALLLTVLFAVTLFAQNTVSPKPSAGIPKLTTWHVNDAYSLKYDPKVWMQTATKGDNGETIPALFLIGPDGKPNQDFLIEAVVFSEPNKLFDEMFAHAHNGILAEKGTMQMKLSEFHGKTENAVFFSYTQTAEDVATVISWYAFPGETNNMKSHTAIVLVSLFPAKSATVNINPFDPIEDVIRTFTIAKVTDQ